MANTKVNPNKHCNAITTRSRKVLEARVKKRRVEKIESEKNENNEEKIKNNEKNK